MLGLQDCQVCACFVVSTLSRVLRFTVNMLAVSTRRIVSRSMAASPKTCVVRAFSETLTIPKDIDQQYGRRLEEMEAELAGEVGFNKTGMFVVVILPITLVNIKCILHPTIRIISGRHRPELFPKSRYQRYRQCCAEL